MNAENPDYKNLVDLLAMKTDLEIAIKEIDSQIQSDYLALVDTFREQWTKLNEKLSKVDSSIAEIARRHPEWFAAEKTVKTPYGQVRSTKTTSLEVPSPEATLRLIKLAGREAEFIRTTEAPDLEALGRLSDDELATFGVVRVVSESITAKAAKVDLGKAVKEAEKAEAKKKKAKAPELAEAAA